ncbi:MAG: tripartite tricarboxylate transporter substrate-binding protein [Rhizobiaceae bacterium]
MACLLSMDILPRGRGRTSKVLGGSRRSTCRSAAQRAASAEPDGYTLLLAAGSEMLITKQVNSQIAYDRMNDLHLLMCVDRLGDQVHEGRDAARPVIQCRRVGEIDEFGKRFGSDSRAAGDHHRADTQHGERREILVGAPYRGSGPVMTDVIGDHVDVGVTSLASAIAFIRSGQAKTFALTAGTQRPGTGNTDAGRAAGDRRVQPGTVSGLSRRPKRRRKSPRRSRQP